MKTYEQLAEQWEKSQEQRSNPLHIVLAMLGPHPEFHLLALEIRGDQGSGSCPIAEYLKLVGFKEPLVTAYGMVRAGDCEMGLPWPCHVLVHEFDRGRHQELEL